MVECLPIVHEPLDYTPNCWGPGGGGGCVCVCVSQVQDVWVHREEEELNMS